VLRARVSRRPFPRRPEPISNVALPKGREPCILASRTVFVADDDREAMRHKNERLGERFEQRLGLLQVGRVETLGEPCVDRREQVVCFPRLALLLP
jgi:hypothetical protein